jgi:hypothetical protein
MFVVYFLLCADDKKGGIVLMGGPAISQHPTPSNGEDSQDTDQATFNIDLKR